MKVSCWSFVAFLYRKPQPCEEVILAECNENLSAAEMAALKGRVLEWISRSSSFSELSMQEDVISEAELCKTESTNICAESVRSVSANRCESGPTGLLIPNNSVSANQCESGPTHNQKRYICRRRRNKHSPVHDPAHQSHERWNQDQNHEGYGVPALHSETHQNCSLDRQRA